MPLYNDLHMRTLIIQLPSGSPSPTLAYPHAWVEAEPGSRPLTLQWAAAALLPAADRQSETVALVPAAALSWHRVELPAGLHKQAQRVKAALHGLLEDRLLGRPRAPCTWPWRTDWTSAAQPWVAACDRVWLSAHLQALESSGPAGAPHRARTLARHVQATRCSCTALGDADTRLAVGAATPSGASGASPGQPCAQPDWRPMNDWGCPSPSGPRPRCWPNPVPWPWPQSCWALACASCPRPSTG
jgi:hypothetical protein